MKRKRFPQQISRSTPAELPAVAVPPPVPDSPATRQLSTKTQLGVLLALVTLVVFFPACFNQFKLDELHLVGHPRVREGLTASSVSWAFTTMDAENWHPVTWLTFQYNYELFGAQPFGYQLTNVLLHVANAVVLYLLLCGMTAAVWRSAIVAALFALHPLRVESICVILNRKDVLGAFFWLLTMWAYCRWVERPGWRRYFTMLLLFALGLMSKPMLVTLPFALLLLDYWPLQRHRQTTDGRQSQLWIWTNLALEKLPLLGLAIADCVLTFIAQRGAGEVRTLEQFPVATRIPNALLTYVIYLRQTLWPEGLAFFYPHEMPALWEPRVLLSAAFLIAVTLFALRQIGRKPYLLMGWLWYLGTLVPVIGLVQVGDQGHADRYTYLPCIGILLAAVWAVSDFAVPLAGRMAVEPNLLRRRLAWATAALLLCWSLATRWQISYWYDPRAILIRHIEALPDDYLGYCKFADFLAAEKDPAAAMHNYEEAIRLKPDYFRAHNNLGIMLLMGGRPSAAVEHLAAAARLEPDNGEAQINLATAMALTGNLDKALEHFAAGVRLQPDNVSAHFYFGQALGKAGKWPDACREFRAAVKGGPGVAKYRCELAYALFRINSVEDARSEYRAARRLDAKYVEERFRDEGAFLARMEGNGQADP